MTTMPTFRAKQAGIVLPVALVLLLVLTISSVVMVDLLSSQTRMATNAAVANVNMQAAESGLRMVVNDLSNGTIPAASSAYLANANGLYYFVATNYSASTLLPWRSVAKWTALANSPAITCASPGNAMAVASCKYMIEMLPPVAIAGSNAATSKTFDNVYRITVRVTGTNGHGTVMLQSLYLMPN